MAELRTILADLRASFLELAFLLLLTFFPLVLNGVIAVIPATDKYAAFTSVLVPGELLAFCFGLITPLAFFLHKSHGSNHKVSGLRFVMSVAFVTYVTALVLNIIARQNLIQGIDFKSGHDDLFMWIAVCLLGVAILLRYYTFYQDSRLHQFNVNRDSEQASANSEFVESIS